MARVFYVHWNDGEAVERAAALVAAGHSVRIHNSTSAQADLKTDLPDVLVVSLDRLPSHGRAIVEWLWEAKRRQHIPVVFEGGAPDKVAATRAKFPHAVYVERAETVTALAALGIPEA